MRLSCSTLSLWKGSLVETLFFWWIFPLRTLNRVLSSFKCRGVVVFIAPIDVCLVRILLSMVTQIPIIFKIHENFANRLFLEKNPTSYSNLKKKSLPSYHGENTFQNNVYTLRTKTRHQLSKLIEPKSKSNSSTI